MTRVSIVVEGQSEESFINDVLAPAFWAQEIYLTAILLGVPGHKGGRPVYARLCKDVLLHLKQDRSAFCSTMLDFYGLGSDFPGKPIPERLDNIGKVKHLEDAVKADVCNRVPELRPDIRFVPYFQLHEFEGLMFSDPNQFAYGINQAQLGSHFQAIREGFATPEDINDGPDTAPSKRVIAEYPRYRKVLHGTAGGKAVGLEAMRRECPHFRAWLERLEHLEA